MKNYHRLNSQDIGYLTKILGEAGIKTDLDSLKSASSDESEDLKFLPEAVIFPKDTSEISAVLKYCNENHIPVTTRGAGTGLSGGALPVSGGIVLSTKFLNKILWIDEQNMQACVEPGVVNYVFQEEVKKKNLFYPPDPASWQSCTMGGNVAHVSGGPRAVKYGTTRDYILNLEVVLANGDIIQTGANTLKYSTGYNLTHLMIGSEGTLGIITKIITRLIPYPSCNVLLMVPFVNATEACKMVNELILKGCRPSALEFMEGEAIRLSARYCGSVPFEIKPEWDAILLIEADGFTQDEAMHEAEKISSVLECKGYSEIWFAQSAEEKEALWKIRRKAGEAVRHTSVYKEEDTVVPRACLPELLEYVRVLCKENGIRAVCYGHAGDGNLHVNILKEKLPDHIWKNRLPGIIRQLFQKCKSLGGTISGEHGIGYVQKEYMPVVFPEYHMELFRQIKKVFDPNLILNPEKICF
ncbi:MAG: FAD-binding protein [Bacteroidia bacterium]|nr:FAD-binding protein [Bacteroidia bacterium]